MPGQNAITWSAAREENDVMNKTKQPRMKKPKFENEDEEAKWIASRRQPDPSGQHPDRPALTGT
jgi:hypothetical protein